MQSVALTLGAIIALLFRQASPRFSALSCTTLQAKPKTCEKNEGLYFIPSQVGLADLQKGFLKYGPLGENDHEWHKIEEGDITPTEKKPSVAITADELLRNFEHVVWDEARASEALGI